MTDIVEGRIHEMIVCNVDPLILEPFDDSNPWMVDNVATFLKYCCPECDFKENDLQSFSDHAIQNHENAYALFDDVSPDICAESEEIDTKSYIDSDSNQNDDFKKIDIKTETKDLVLEGDHAMDDSKIFVDGVLPKKNKKKSLPQNHLPITNTGPKIKSCCKIKPKKYEQELESSNPNLSMEIFTCPREGCIFKTQSKSALQKHIPSHYDCHLCKATFHGASAKRNLENHVKKHIKNHVKKHPINGEIGKSYKPQGYKECEQCGRCFQGPNAIRDLTNHMKKHNKITVTICHFCNRDYKTKKQLNYHKKRHCKENLTLINK